MSLLVVLRSLPAAVGRYEPTFDRTRPTQPLFAAYPTAVALLGALSLDSPLSVCERQELVRALVTLHRSTRHPLWPALLLHAFRPMLLSLRRRDRGSREDRDSRVLLAFFQALERTPVEGQPVFITLQRATARALFQAVRAQRFHAETVALDTALDPAIETHRESRPFTACLARELAAQVLASRDSDPVRCRNLPSPASPAPPALKSLKNLRYPQASPERP